MPQTRKKSAIFFTYLIASLSMALFMAGARESAAAEISVGGGNFNSPARHALLIDAETGAVLFEKDADQRVPPASMSKLMTIYMVFERLAAGTLKLDDTFLVSERAWRTGGSKMFVGIGERVTVDDLLRGVIVQSGNDACIVLAEGLAGDEAAFAKSMTEAAKRIGLKNSTFANSTGLPDPDHLMTSRDLAHLARLMIKEFPQYYGYFAEAEFSYNQIAQANRNPLLLSYEGSDGLKTGHTEEAGYGLTASAKLEDRRLILVLGGLASEAQRAAESKRLLDFGFHEFENFRLVSTGDVQGLAEVFQGKPATVPLVATEDVVVTGLKGRRPEATKTIDYPKALPAPIAQGSVMATLTLSAPGNQPIETPLAAGLDVERLGFFGRIAASIGQMFSGLIESGGGSGSGGNDG
jgi:D-alanyl-D-alanine carboxypeptidase (penicillin-binding protein 5/6)